MPSPSYSYTLTNGTTADADQVMQNFDDILNGVTDGTKDLSIAALTVAGTATFNGNVTLGNAAADDITFSGSLASTIPIKTDASFDIGSTSLGLRRAYFGGNSQRVGIGASGSTSATWNLTLPVSAGTAGYHLITNGSGVSSWTTAIKGTDTNDSAATGYVGEYTSAACSAATTTTAADTDIDVTGMSITLTAGDWEVGYDVALSLDRIGTTGIVQGRVKITDSSNNNVADSIAYAATSSIASGTGASYSVSRRARISISSTTTYKVRIAAGAANTAQTATVQATSITGSFTNPDNQSLLWARRVR